MKNIAYKIVALLGLTEKKVILTEHNLFIMRKNEEFSLIDAMLNDAMAALRRSEEKV